MSTRRNNQETTQRTPELGAIEAPLIYNYGIEVDYGFNGIRQFAQASMGRSETLPSNIAPFVKQGAMAEVQDPSLTYANNTQQQSNWNLAG